MPRPTAPLFNGDLFRHRHHMLTLHLPGMYPALQRFQGSLIATHIVKVAVEMRRDREVKALIRQADAEKRLPYLLGYNLAYLLRLGQLADHEGLPLVCK